MRAPASALLVAVALLATLLASGCGFHLRGAYALPEAMDSTHVEYSGQDTAIRRATVRALILNDIRIAASVEQASAVLKLLQATTSREVLSRDRNGRPQEYAITVNLAFSVVRPDGTTIVEPAEVSAETVLALDTTNPLASRSELEAATESLRDDAVTQMIRAIAAAGNEIGVPESPQ